MVKKHRRSCLVLVIGIIAIAVIMMKISRLSDSVPGSRWLRNADVWISNAIVHFLENISVDSHRETENRKPVNRIRKQEKRTDVDVTPIPISTKITTSKDNLLVNKYMRDTKQMERALQSMLSLAKPVVYVRSFSGQEHTRTDGLVDIESNVGAGFVVSMSSFQSLIFTAAHLINGHDVTVLPCLSCSSVPADVQHRDESLDLVIIRISNRNQISRSPIKIRTERSPLEGERCWVVRAPTTAKGSYELVSGFVRNIPPELTASIKEFMPQLDGKAIFALSQLTKPGYSGAPVLGEDGAVIGIVVGGAEWHNEAQLSLAISSVELSRFLSANTR